MASAYIKDVDPAFQALGSPKDGLNIWRIEKLKVASLPKDQYGKFYTGDSYIVLKTTALKAGGFSYAVHFWLGKETSQDEAGVAAIKTVELDAYLGGKAVQYREVQGHETDLFLSYFRPCIIALPGGVATGFKSPEERKQETRLWQVKGKRFVRVRQIPFSRSSLSHSDVYILDTPTKIFQFNGANSSRSEQGKALEVTQAIKGSEHDGKCDISIIDDGKMGDEDSTQFWAQFGGYAPIAKKGNLDDDADAKATPAKLIWAGPGGLKETVGGLKKSMLESNKCYLVDTGSEIYVWIGRISPLEERKEVAMAAENKILREKRPPSTGITRVTERYETPMFKSNFDEWPVAPLMGDSSSKVKGMLKQAGVVDIKAMAKGPAPVDDSNLPPLADTSGKLDVWRIDGADKVAISGAEIGRFYSGDCYIVQYTYVRERKNEYLIFFWQGRNSTQEERGVSAILATKMAEQVRGHHILGRVVQGKEPEQFLQLFRDHLLFFKGGLGRSYKKVVGSSDHTYSPTSVALFHVKGTAGNNIRATQVEPVAKSLTSSDCFVLQTPSVMFTWIGQYSSDLEKKSVAVAADFLRPGGAVKQQVEGKEVSAFWQNVGGKGEYAQSREARDVGKDARLFSVSNATGTLRVAEVYNFTQEDLLSEDVMILDAYSEIFVWVGNDASDQEKKDAFDIAQKYLEFVALAEQRSKDTALLKIQEGNEPPMFTAHFAWDPTKAPSFVDPYERKLAELQGRPIHLTEAQKRRSTLHHKDTPQDSTASSGAGSPAARVINSASSQRAAALAALSSSFVSPAAKKAAPLAESGRQLSEGPATDQDGNRTSSQRVAALSALSGSLQGKKTGSAWDSVGTTKVAPRGDRSPKSSKPEPTTTDPIKEPEPLAKITPDPLVKPADPVPAPEPAPAPAPAPVPAPVPAPEPVEPAEPAVTSVSSQRAAALAALSGSLVAEKKVFGRVQKKPISVPQTVKPPEPEPEPKPPTVVEKKEEEPKPKVEEPEVAPVEPDTPAEVVVEPTPPPAEAAVEPAPPPAPLPSPKAEEVAAVPAVVEEGTFPLERVVLSSGNPAPGIDPTKRESYLSNADFEALFHVSKESFYAMPKWKQDQKKRVHDLF